MEGRRRAMLLGLGSTLMESGNVGNQVTPQHTEHRTDVIVELSMQLRDVEVENAQLREELRLERQETKRLRLLVRCYRRSAGAAVTAARRANATAAPLVPVAGGSAVEAEQEE